MRIAVPRSNSPRDLSSNAMTERSDLVGKAVCTDRPFSAPDATAG
jgi:hypothetical protein